MVKITVKPFPEKGAADHKAGAGAENPIDLLEQEIYIRRGEMFYHVTAMKIVHGFICKRQRGGSSVQCDILVFLFQFRNDLLVAIQQKEIFVSESKSFLFSKSTLAGTEVHDKGVTLFRQIFPCQ